GRLRQLRLGELAHSQDDTFLRAFEGFSRLVYPAGHPFFRRSFDERKRGLEAVTRADLVRVHDELYTPSTLVLVLVGDFDP
ncbi:MAG: insulinase family protein, partial [Acidobacteria bacterium]|nr:insulinase family protein [Acidobacteriota bacterium]